MEKNMAKTTKSIKLSLAEVKSFKDLDARAVQMKQEESQLLGSVLESRGVDLKTVVTPVNVGEGYVSIDFTIETPDEPTTLRVV
jgi:hypothetical protein